jgi:release factor glutamine methyltransferase
MTSPPKPTGLPSLPPPTDTPWTVRRVLAWTREEFLRRGVDGARLDAEVLLAHALKCSRMQLYLEMDKPLLPDELGAFKAMVKRRAARVPVSQIVGSREFWNRRFSVSSNVLTPRPETEQLVEDVLAHAKTRPVSSILDVGTGSGCLAISLALELAGSRVTAVDVSPEALVVARANGTELGATVEWLQSDLLTALPAEARFDVVVSNPPYLTPAEWDVAMPEVKQHEPRLALVGDGDDGLGHHRRLAQQVLPRLIAGGGAWIELGWKQGPAALELWKAAASSDDTVDLLKDLEGRDRVIRVKRAVSTV